MLVTTVRSNCYRITRITRITDLHVFSHVYKTMSRDLNYVM